MEKEKAENLASNKKNLENFEQRERILTLLHDFYQEQQKNMPVHKEIGELAEKMRGLFEKVNPLIDKFYGEESEVEEQYTTRRCSLEIERTEIVQKWNQKEKYGWQDAPEIVGQLEKMLRGEVFDKKPTKEEEKQLSEFIENIKETDDKINENVKKLWEIRKKIAEQFLGLPEFLEWNGAVLNWSGLQEGLYNLNSSIKATKSFQSEKGTEEDYFYFDLGAFTINKKIGNLKQKYNITDKELKEIKDLEWSGEEKIKLKKFRKEAENYAEKSAEITKSFLEIKKTFEFDEQGAENIKIEMTRAFVRGRYKENGLPSIHKTRAVQEIMNGTFKWPE